MEFVVLVLGGEGERVKPSGRARDATTAFGHGDASIAVSGVHRVALTSELFGRLCVLPTIV